jgi:hypothetical protein
MLFRQLFTPLVFDSNEHFLIVEDTAKSWQNRQFVTIMAWNAGTAF